MGITLPGATNKTQQDAQKFIEEIERVHPVLAGLDPTHIVRTAFKIYADRRINPAVFACAGRLMAEYIPIPDISKQWAFICMFICPQPHPLTTDQVYFASTNYALLRSLHTKAFTDRPDTLEDFRTFAHATVDPAIKDTNISTPPFTLDIITPLRNGYAILVEYYYAP